MVSIVIGGVVVFTIESRVLKLTLVWWGNMIGRIGAGGGGRDGVK